MKDDITKDELIEMIKSNLNIDGWQGVVCLGCKPKQNAPFPAKANVEMGIVNWICPRCGFINLLTFRKRLPVFTHPDFGILGSVIVEAYKELELDLNFDFEALEKEKK